MRRTGAESSSSQRNSESNYIQRASDQSISFKLDPNEISTLRKRIVRLEIENADLQNYLLDLRSQQLESEQKITFMQKQMIGYEAENTNLKDALNNIIEDLANFKVNISNELKDLRRPQSRTESSFDISAVAKTLARDFATPIRSQHIRREDGTFSGILAITKTNGEEDLDIPSMISLTPRAELAFGSTPSNSRTEQRFMFGRQCSDTLERSLSSYFYPILARLDPKPAENIPEALPQGNNKIQPVELGHAKESEIFTPEKVFEDFFVFGPDKDKVNEYFLNTANNSALGSKRSAIFEGKMLFGLADKLRIPHDIHVSGISEVLLPNGFTVTEYTNDTEIDKVFSRAAFSGETCQEKYVCPLESQIVVNKWSQYAEAVNPQRKLYVFCLKKEDFYMIDSPQPEQKRLVQIDTLYCFLTYYPIPDLLFKLLDSILVALVDERQEMYSNLEIKDYKSIDFDAINKIFSQRIIPYLLTILNFKAPLPGVTITYPLPNNKDLQDIHEYTYPPESTAYLELAAYNASKVLCTFNLENIALILNAMFLEKSLVFFSKDTSLLLSVINTFMGFIFPYKYICPVVALLPSERMGLCTSPIPIIIGVSKKEKDFWKEKLYKDPQAIFVFIDSKIIFIDKNNKDISEFPKLDFGIKALRRLSPHIRMKSTGFEVVSQVETLAERHRLKLINDQKGVVNSSQDLSTKGIDKQIVEKVFSHFRSYVEKNIVGYCGDLEKDMNSEKIKSLVRDSNLVEFLKEWIKTMGFSNYSHMINPIEE